MEVSIRTHKLLILIPQQPLLVNLLPRYLAGHLFGIDSPQQCCIFWRHFFKTVNQLNCLDSLGVVEIIYRMWNLDRSSPESRAPVLSILSFCARPTAQPAPIYSTFRGVNTIGQQSKNKVLVPNVLHVTGRLVESIMSDCGGQLKSLAKFNSNFCIDLTYSLVRHFRAFCIDLTYSLVGHFRA